MNNFLYLYIMAIIVVGAGISGLNIALKLIKKKKHVVIYDKADYVGGRIYTNKHTLGSKKYMYEAGAARFNKNHSNLKQLIKKYKLNNKIVKIPSKWDTIFTKNIKSKKFNSVDELLDDIIKKGGKISNKVKQSLTLYELVKSVYDNETAIYLKHAYPYYSELMTLNSYDSLRMMEHDLNESHNFYVLDGGMGQLINNMKDDFIKKGGTIKLNHSLEDINIVDDDFICDFNVNGKLMKSMGTDVIMACDGFSLQKMKWLKKFNILDLLNNVKCQPLLRTYAIYNNKWFNNLPKTVTNEHIKYIIPIDYKSGLIMISYTDGEYAKYWKKIIDSPNGAKKQKSELLKELSILFPDIKIGNPNDLINHYWERGACYWKKNVNSNIQIKKMVKPTKYNLFICGDSYSARQAWMEGALETSNEVLKYF